jgi:oligoribonuclease NrnB/cAMP/cGMP phosphodiesterase (DHH superfamily)
VISLPGRGDLLSITDLGYQNDLDEKVEKAKKNGWKIAWRDHHRWQQDELNRLSSRIDLLHVDTQVCACGITARDLRPGDPVAGEIASVVCDYDLWKNQDPRAAVLARVVSREENRDHVRDCLAKGVFSDSFIEEQYGIIQREMQEDIEKSLRKTRIFENRYRIAVAPQYGYPSETAAAIRRFRNTDIEVLVYPSGRFSIRSVPPISHLIAREFRGGGHAHAAGGSFNFSFLDRLSFLLLRSSHQIREMVAFTESIE